MDQQDESNDFYAAGRKLAEYITDSSGMDIPTATIQALIRDFLPHYEELQEPLRSIVARPDFLQLTQLAGSEKGVAQKNNFVTKLKKIYSTETICAADSLTCGMLLLKTTDLLSSQNEFSQPNETLYGSKEITSQQENMDSRLHYPKNTESAVDAIDNKLPHLANDDYSQNSVRAAGCDVKKVNVLKPNRNWHVAIGAALLQIALLAACGVGIIYNETASDKYGQDLDDTKNAQQAGADLRMNLNSFFSRVEKFFDEP